MENKETMGSNLPSGEKLLEKWLRGHSFEKERLTIDHPAMYRVVLLNDDITPMEFVVTILRGLFHKDGDDALKVMLQTHQDGQGYCGTYTRDVAETKMIQVINSARESNFPLKCIIKKDYSKH